MSQKRSLFDTIAAQGNDHGYHPRVTKNFHPTSARAGSPEKIAVLRWRVERGLPLWHRDDRAGVRLEGDDYLDVDHHGGGPR
jgi:hypothetical protein